jgi:o-succinylbenzoate synthase
VKFRFQFRRYRLPFRAAVRTAHGVWSEREGISIRLEDETGTASFGEAAPVPHFGTETVEQDEAACRAIGEWTDDATLLAVPFSLPALRFALGCARRSWVSKPAREYLPVAALLPAGKAALAVIPERAEIGFRVFKWKVGVADAADEISLLDDLCGALPNGAKLRLDANGAWDRRRSERWLERCADRPIEFVEQPIDSSSRGADDLLQGLAADYPTPIGLDESLVSDGDIGAWIERGWPGVFVVKPSLLADPLVALAHLEKAKASVVFSSALETAVGARSALELAFAWRGEARALGFGVWPRFADGTFDGPAAAPFVRVEDLARINPEAVWNALN